MIKFESYGDSGLLIRLGSKISKETNKEIRRICESLRRQSIPGIIEWIPSYTNITILYDPYVLPLGKLKEELNRILNSPFMLRDISPQIIEIPTCYGGNYGPDLLYVARYHGISYEDVISIHSGQDYLIYMMGFSPGFPYLGGMSKRIATPRLEKPRLKTPAGSIGIAGKQTGIYSLDTPGGWRIIGKTPLRLLTIAEEAAFLLKVGDYVRFVPITEKIYKEIEQEVIYGTYIPVTRPYIEN